MYAYDQRPKTKFTDGTNTILNEIGQSEYAVLVGPNNCGKSFVLKSLTQQLGQNASYLGPARYQNFHLLGYYTPNRNKKQEKWQQFVQQWQREQQNIDNSPLNLQQAIAELNDSQRNHLGEIIRILLGTEIEILHTVPDNSMSQKFISCDGHNISFTSSGFRLITALVTSLLDDGYDTFLVDEPELGISPEAQGVLADFLFDRDHRARYFSHIRTLILATHSTLFLDRRNVSNNFVVKKNGDDISVSRVTDQSSFNNIHFFLLGNRLETLYLPSLIVLVEGKCDYLYVRKVLAVRFPTYQFGVIPAHSDNRIKEVLHTAAGLFGDIQKSPYKDRILVVLDSVHQPGLKDTLMRMGVAEANIVIWPKNGIEFYYPEQIMSEIYGLGGEVVIEDDLVSRNGIRYKKSELVEKVSERLSKETHFDEDFSDSFLSRVERALGAM